MKEKEEKTETQNERKWTRGVGRSQKGKSEFGRGKRGRERKKERKIEGPPPKKRGGAIESQRRRRTRREGRDPENTGHGGEGAGGRDPGDKRSEGGTWTQ